MSSADRYRIPARAEGLVSREVDGGFVVLDSETDQAHHLHGLPAEVWRLAGEQAPSDLDRDALDDTVAALLDLGLLTTPSYQPSRRALLRVGGLAVAVAGVESMALPSAAWAASANSSLPFPIANDPNNTGGPQTLPYTVKIPDYTDVVSFTLVSGGGGSASSGGAGGSGVSIQGKITLSGTRTSGFTPLTVYVGGAGAAGSGTAAAGLSGYGPGGAGFSVSGNGSGGGGGASAILSGTTPLVVAGGGGGGGFASGTAGSTQGGDGGSGGLLGSDGASPTFTATAINLPAPTTGNDLGDGQTTASGFTMTTSANAALLSPGDRVVFSSVGGTAGNSVLVAGVPYTVSAVSGNAVTLQGITSYTALRTITTITRVAEGDLGKATLAGSAVTFTSTPSLAVGDRLVFGAGSNASVTAGLTYFVLSVTGKDVTISTTSGGTAVTGLTGTGWATKAIDSGLVKADLVGTPSSTSGSPTLTFPSAHGLAVGDRIAFASSTRGWSVATVYLVSGVTGTTQITTTTTGGTAVSGTGTGSGNTGAVYRVAPGSATNVTASVSANNTSTINLSNGVGFQTGDRVMFGVDSTGGNQGAKISAGTVYYVVAVGTNTIGIATTSGVSAFRPGTTSSNPVVKIGGSPIIQVPVTTTANSANVSFPTGHGLAVGDRVAFRNLAAVSDGLPLYVVASGTNNVTVSARPGTGAPTFTFPSGVSAEAVFLNVSTSDGGSPTINTTADTLTSANVASTSFPIGARVVFGVTSGTGTVVPTAGTIYYVLAQTGTTTQSVMTIANSSGGTRLQLSNITVGVATRLAPVDVPPPVNFASGSSTVTFTSAHGLAVGQRVRFTGVTPNIGFASNQWYYVATATTTTVTLTLYRGNVSNATNTYESATANGTATGAEWSDANVSDGVSGGAGSGSGQHSGGGLSGVVAAGTNGASGTATAGAGGSLGQGAGQADGTPGTLTARTGGAGANTARPGGGGGGGYAPGGGGEGADTNGTSRRGGGGGGGASYTAGVVAPSGVTFSISSVTSINPAGAVSGGPGQGGSVSFTDVTPPKP